MSTKQAQNTLPTIEVLNALFEYKDGRIFNRINRRTSKAGEESGFLHKSSGYRAVKVNGSRFSTHRIIFSMHHGWCPDFVDHVNGNPLDNSIENLRPATRSQNMYNRKLNANNTSGVKGVYWCAPKKAWVAQIAVNAKRRSLGTFKTKELATEFLELAREMFHGEFANHGMKKQ